MASTMNTLKLSRLETSSWMPRMAALSFCTNTSSSARSHSMDPAILEDLCAGGRGEVGAFFDCDNEGLLRGDQAGLLDPGAVMPKAMGAIVFAMLGCNGGVR